MWQGVVNHEEIKKVLRYYEALNTAPFNIHENCINAFFRGKY
jgi:hypothetical protein